MLSLKHILLHDLDLSLGAGIDSSVLEISETSPFSPVRAVALLSVNTINKENGVSIYLDNTAARTIINFLSGILSSSEKE